MTKMNETEELRKLSGEILNPNDYEYPLSDELLRQWQNFSDIEDLMYRHFDEVDAKHTDPYAIADYACKTWYAMFNERVEEHSAVDAILSACSVTGFHLALQMVAQMKNLDLEALEEDVFEFWFEGKYKITNAQRRP